MLNKFKTKINATVIILTLNERLHLERLLKTIINKFDSIVVIDSGSSDETVQIAKNYGANVIYNKWPGDHASQLNWAIDNANITSDWIVRIDADEILPDEVISELCSKLKNATPSIGGFEMKRGNIFLGRKIRYGGTFPTKIIRVWRTGRARCDGRLMDEKMIIDSDLAIDKIDAIFWDHNLNSLSQWIEKHNKYATNEAIEQILRRKNSLKLRGLIAKNSPNVSILKKFYEKSPRPIRALSYFFYRYIVRLGFLDGFPGFLWHFFQGFWYRLLVDAKVFEFENITGDNDQDMAKIISQNTKYDIKVDAKLKKGDN